MNELDTGFLPGSDGAKLYLPAGVDPSASWKRAVVRVTGEHDGDEALAFAAALGNERGMEIIAVYVEDAAAGLERAAHYADALHHEYPSQLAEFVARALPHCSNSDRETVREVVLCRGDPATELRRVIDRRGADVLIVGASTDLDEITRDANIPVLVVRSGARQPFRLKVGAWLE